ncbi:hypothetical protein EW026_g2328 [Hermanssonia centrifuga]|uniref:Metallo-beta-lactamase domain-containing protein n=1 Tax=Hermanssonia centrifuga TaxID=98765 RepID=A0A4S4KNN2_9APHY|nr:hypothetical protein EW026_g2328 [Hermanssonia centrifuga]
MRAGLRSTGPSGTSAADSAASSSPPPFQLPGKTLSVLPIGLAVFAGISVIALIVVGLVTYERTNLPLPQAFRQRKLAESGANMGYGGMARVDKLTITFLVDNNIEWFGKLPPGFTHELRQHITDHNPPIDPVTGAPTIDFENYCCGAHGFSALIETQAEGESETHYTLFDAGPESRSIARNVAAMRIPVERVERVVLSHWHSDHSGGILAFLRMHREASKNLENAQACVVDLHPDRPIARGIAPGGKIMARLAPDPTFEEIENEGGVVDKHADGHAVAGNTVWISGEIPRLTEYEKGIIGGVRPSEC